MKTYNTVSSNTLNNIINVNNKYIGNDMLKGLRFTVT